MELKNIKRPVNGSTIKELVSNRKDIKGTKLIRPNIATPAQKIISKECNTNLNK